MALLIKLFGTRLFYVTANAGQTLAQVREYVNTHSKPNADLVYSELFFFDPLDPESPGPRAAGLSRGGHSRAEAPARRHVT